jgi:hypothetical protein
MAFFFKILLAYIIEKQATNFCFFTILLKTMLGVHLTVSCFFIESALGSLFDCSICKKPGNIGTLTPTCYLLLNGLMCCFLALTVTNYGVP